MGCAALHGHKNVQPVYAFDHFLAQHRHMTAANSLPAAQVYPVRVWDLPTRLFHWALAAAVVGLVITGNVGGNAMVWHLRLGYALRIRPARLSVCHRICSHRL